MKHFKKKKKYVIIGVYALKPAFDLRKYSRFSLQMPFAFSRNSSIGCGGQATVAFYPKDVVELTALIQQLTQDGTRYCVLGNLTNVLPPDGVAESLLECVTSSQLKRELV